MRIEVIVLSFIILSVLVSGCSVIESAGNELGNCMEKCSSVCDVLANDSSNLEGYSVTLTKQSGAATISCSCPC